VAGRRRREERHNRRRLIPKRTLPVVEQPRGFEERVAKAPPVAIIWPYPSSPSSYVTAGQEVAVPPQRCPSCLRWLVGWGGYWRWLRAPLLVERIWIRRGRCSACRRSHALLPDLVLVQRLDAVEVIGAGLARKLTSRLGLRLIAEQLDVPHSTLRSWWQRFRARSPMLLAQCTALAVTLDGTAVVLEAVGERAAVESLSVAWQRAGARFGERIGGVWSFWSRISGGQALGTHTTSPWAPGAGPEWMAPSSLGGPAP
jgi:transposase-like protein